MKKEKMIRIASVVFICFSAFSLLSVSLMAFFDPQAVMDLVGVKLENTDAYSSIRGVYGGVGMSLVISLIYLIVKKDIKQALGFLALLWGFYALSRTITIFLEGPLGAFGTQWIITEAVLLSLAVLLLQLNKSVASQKQNVLA